jgi:cysteine desulfurase NifS/selenium donor protein
MNPVYLDYNATTPVDPAVAEEMIPFLTSVFGNPSSIHAFGSEARVAVERARKRLAGLLGCHPDEVIFTSGGTEANNLAIRGIAFANHSKGNHVITSSIEHPSVSEVCRYLERFDFRITRLPVDRFGQVDPADVEKAITPSTILITIMHANNEVGTIQPVGEIGGIAEKFGIPFHTDAAQSIGKIPTEAEKMKAGLVSVAGHKFYAPKGVGALYLRRGVKIEKLIHGADHEQNLRAGTENVMQIAGLGKASEICTREQDSLKLKFLRDRLHAGIEAIIPEVRLNGHPDRRLPNTLSLGFPGVDAPTLLDRMKGVAASAGAACHAGSAIISGVLDAMKVPAEYARGTLRFSVGRMTTEAEVDRAIPLIAGAYLELRGREHKHLQPFPPAGHRATDDEKITLPQKASELPEAEAGMQKSPEIFNVTRLTEYTRSLGCACKIQPQLLEKILKEIPRTTDPSVLVGIETSDDAAVYRLDEETAIVETVDFIPPIVDDPYTYGAIAAANSISDIYAMGAEPVFALGIVSFPVARLPVEVLRQIVKGATEKAAEAGIPVIGGHSIDDDEPKFGLVVTGKADPVRILRNSGARPGDVIVLTKPLGTGIITTALKRGVAQSGQAEEAIRSMTQLNHQAALVMKDFPVNGCTDVTGFGLLGHLKGMSEGSSVAAEVWCNRVPVFPEALEFAAAGIVPGGTLNNMKFTEKITRFGEGVPEIMKTILSDAQTSGGLLISLPEEHAHELISKLHAAGVTLAEVIGRFVKGAPSITVKQI